MNDRDNLRSIIEEKKHGITMPYFFFTMLISEMDDDTHPLAFLLITCPLLSGSHFVSDNGSTATVGPRLQELVIPFLGNGLPGQSQLSQPIMTPACVRFYVKKLKTLLPNVDHHRVCVGGGGCFWELIFWLM